MKYVEEVRLKEQFWKNYKYRSNIIASQFECQARHGGIDLLTIEKVKDKEGSHIEFVSFEFKLEDIEKALSQALINSEWCHKNFIVVPIQKKKVILDRYQEQLKKYSFIGCIGVEFEGKWDMFWKCRPKPDASLKLSQEIIKLCCHEM